MGDADLLLWVSCTPSLRLERVGTAKLPGVPRFSRALFYGERSADVTNSGRPQRLLNAVLMATTAAEI